MKKFHWGHGITLFFTLFVIAMMTVLFMSFGVDRTLVVDNYYEKDIHYQEQFDKKQNQINNETLNINYDASIQQLVLHFDHEEQVTGQVTFYRPSDKSIDYSIDITANNLLIPTSEMKKGKWRVKVDWIANSKTYYKEQIIYI